jgi:hypothetical protein
MTPGGISESSRWRAQLLPLFWFRTSTLIADTLFARGGKRLSRIICDGEASSVGRDYCSIGKSVAPSDSCDTTAARPGIRQSGTACSCTVRVEHRFGRTQDIVPCPGADDSPTAGVSRDRLVLRCSWRRARLGFLGFGGGWLFRPFAGNRFIGISQAAARRAGLRESCNVGRGQNHKAYKNHGHSSTTGCSQHVSPEIIHFAALARSLPFAQTAAMIWQDLPRLPQSPSAASLALLTSSRATIAQPDPE